MPRLFHAADELQLGEAFTGLRSGTRGPAAEGAQATLATTAAETEPDGVGLIACGNSGAFLHATRQSRPKRAKRETERDINTTTACAAVLRRPSRAASRRASVGRGVDAISPLLVRASAAFGVAVT